MVALYSNLNLWCATDYDSSTAETDSIQHIFTFSYRDFSSERICFVYVYSDGRSLDSYAALKLITQNSITLLVCSYLYTEQVGDKTA